MWNMSLVSLMLLTITCADFANSMAPQPIIIPQKDLYIYHTRETDKLQRCRHTCKYNGTLCEDDHKFYYEKCVPYALEHTVDKLRERFLVAAYANPTGGTATCLKVQAEIEDLPYEYEGCISETINNIDTCMYIKGMAYEMNLRRVKCSTCSSMYCT